jgi:flagellin-like protein
MTERKESNRRQSNRTKSNRTKSDRIQSKRAQSNVIGVAILLGVVVVSLASLTAGIGTVVEQNAASADSARVATDLDSSLEPVAATGVHRGRVSFSDGQLQTAERELRVLNESAVVRTVQTDALVFTAGDRRVAFLAGAVVRGPPDNARVRTSPPITASRADNNTDNGDNADDTGVLVVGAPELNGSVEFSATGGGSVVLQTDVSHHRTALGNGTYRVAVETATPDAWRRYFERQNATVTTRDFDGDSVPSVVAEYPGERVAYLVVHDLRLEVRHG